MPPQVDIDLTDLERSAAIRILVASAGQKVDGGKIGRGYIGADRAGRPQTQIVVGYGTGVGQMPPPDAVHVIRPWIAGLIGVLAIM